MVLADMLCCQGLYSVVLEMRPEGWITWQTLQYILLSVIIPLSRSLKCFECGTQNTVSQDLKANSFVLSTEDGCIEIIQISCADFLPLPEHYRECEGSQASCVSTLGRFDMAVVETKECGEKAEGGGELCNTRVLGGGARVTVCHCRENFCNKYSVQVGSQSHT